MSVWLSSSSRRPLCRCPVALLQLTLVAVWCATVCAVPPFGPNLVDGGQNRWEVTAYVDSSGSHQQSSTQGICFFATGTQGSQQTYEWASDTFPNWRGRARQEGDQVFMYGNYDNFHGRDAFVWEIASSGLGTGSWIEWRDGGSLGNTIGFFNAVWRRVGRCNANNAGSVRSASAIGASNSGGSSTGGPAGSSP